MQATALSWRLCSHYLWNHTGFYLRPAGRLTNAYCAEETLPPFAMFQQLFFYTGNSTNQKTGNLADSLFMVGRNHQSSARNDPNKIIRLLV
jgi:hypothetical protein